jgi:hypothetical protein
MLLLAATDQLTGEVIPCIMGNVMAKGGKNVHLLSAMTKKGRPEFILLVHVDEERLDEVGSYLAAELGILGFRVLEARHKELDYEIKTREIRIRIKNGEIEDLLRVKVVKKLNGDFQSVNVEYEDLKRLYDKLSEIIQLPMMKLKGMVEGEILKDLDSESLFMLL